MFWFHSADENSPIPAPLSTFPRSVALLSGPGCAVVGLYPLTGFSSATRILAGEELTLFSAERGGALACSCISFQLWISG